MPWACNLHSLPLSLLPADEGGQMCNAGGELLWGKTPDGVDTYSLCYAPSMRTDRLGPSSGHQQCDLGSYFMVEAPKFCCRRPRIDMDGKLVKATSKVCGDLLAEFDPETQRFKVVRGPTTTGSAAQLEQMGKSGLQNMTPLPEALQTMKDACSWKPVLNAKCQGSQGTLLKWSCSNPPGRAEMCKTGTPPVQGQGYSSWDCDGADIVENRFHCCTVGGKTHCVRGFVDATAVESCRCPGIGGPKEFL